MVNIGEAAGGAVVVGCKVLPMWRDSGMLVDGAMKTMVHGRKAVARVKELLRRAAQPQPRPPHTPTTASRWKKVLSFQARGGGGGSSSKAGDDSASKLSFKWDAGSCSSASSSSALYSPLSAVSAPAKAPSRSATASSHGARRCCTAQAQGIGSGLRSGSPPIQTLWCWSSELFLGELEWRQRLTAHSKQKQFL
ncbi:hypothetical protein GUJ93_ZPchr0012g22097 [Zizania palustris]|uniref:Uncharacterized protein n=1 Tax=Zizania palustris TaxID=103762 RepID=A0A8J5WSA0_ZIZPA|nr:hypothetical protein GUJ93_ZPchr0012g22097 [Zizania palustris]